ncbi:MAG: hypothetical protein NTY53_00895 [Kiritimatiellaeota bacterium]|nr:hypothetical protein [Kiritimatiellota bacterium]
MATKTGHSHPGPQGATSRMLAVMNTTTKPKITVKTGGHLVMLSLSPNMALYGGQILFYRDA